MITEEQVVLVATTEQQLEELCHYEAIEIIKDEGLVEGVWRRNKTPLIIEKNLSEDGKRKYPIVDVPEYIFGPEDFISFCHKHGFECGEYCTQEKYDTSKEDCFLCDMANHMGIKGPLSIYNQKVKQDWAIIIYESENFQVKIEWGCLKKGMLMICPKQHVLSAANIPKEQIAEYYQVMQDIEFLLKAVYGDEPVIFFEHGSSPNGLSSHQRSVVHAHTHVAWGVKFPQKYLDMVCLEPVNDIRQLSTTKYFSYQEGTKGQLLAVTNPAVYVQRQYPRQVIGLLLGIENARTNWRKEGFPENVLATYKDIFEYLRDNKDFLAERIVKSTEGFYRGYMMRG